MRVQGSRGAVMRVLMTTDVAGGVWNYALELTRGLGERGVETVLATLGGELTTDQLAAAQAVPGLTLEVGAYPLEWMHRPWSELERAGNWLLGLAARFQPDVVHLNHYCHGALDWPAPVLVTAHSCVFSWFEAVHGGRPDPDWDTYREHVSRGLAGADLVVAPSAAMLAMAERFYGPFSNCRVIPNGRRGGEFRPRSKRSRILATGRLGDEGKNVGALTRVAPELDWPVRLIGQKRHHDSRRQFDNVEWLGQVSRVRLAREYSRASIYALPARYEPFGLSVLEAALSGCALVLGDIPSLREIWGRAALYVQPGDEHGLGQVLNGLIGNSMELQSRGVRARRRARRYSAARMTRAYLAAYGDLMTNHGREGRAASNQCQLAQGEQIVPERR